MMFGGWEEYLALCDKCKVPLECDPNDEEGNCFCPVCGEIFPPSKGDPDFWEQIKEIEENRRRLGLKKSQ